MGLSGADLFLRLARYQDSLQANGDWRGLGSLATPADDACVQPLFRQACAYPFGGTPLSDFLLQRLASVDVLRGGTTKFDEHDCRKPAPHYQGLLPAVGFTNILSFFRSSRFRNLFSHVRRDDGLLRNPTDSHGIVATRLTAFDSADCSRRGTLVIRSERDLSRRALRFAFSTTIL